MKKRKGMFWKRFLFCSAWVLSTVLSTALAYWLMGALPEMGGLEYWARFLNVVQNPFEDYFNEYTSIGIVLSFIVTELLFGIIFLSKISASPMPEAAKEQEIKPSRRQGGKKERKKKAAEKCGKDDKDDVFFKDDVFLKLFNAGYGMAQINAMMELTIHIPEIDAQQMTKMFSASMDEDEIHNYIEAFFG